MRQANRTSVSPIDSQLTLTDFTAVECLNGLLSMLTVLEDDTTVSLAGPRAARRYMPHPQLAKPAEQCGKLLRVVVLWQVVHTHKAPHELEAPRVPFVVHGRFSHFFLSMPWALVTKCGCVITPESKSCSAGNICDRGKIVIRALQLQMHFLVVSTDDAKFCIWIPPKTCGGTCA